MIANRTQSCTQPPLWTDLHAGVACFTQIVRINEIPPPSPVYEATHARLSLCSFS